MSWRALQPFICFDRADEDLCAELDEHLAELERQGQIRPYNREIAAGEEWRQSIDDRLGAADLILLMVSSSLLHWKHRLINRALERHARGGARVIPVIVRPCDWQNSPLAKLQPLPRNGKPVTKWSDRDQAWLEVVRGLRSAIADLRSVCDEPAPPIRWMSR